MKIRRKRLGPRARRPMFNPMTMNLEFAREFFDGRRPTDTRTVRPPAAGGRGEQRVPPGKQPGAAADRVDDAISGRNRDNPKTEL